MTLSDRLCFVLCAQCPDTTMQICVECTCILAVTSLLVAFYVGEVGSGEASKYYEAAWGTNN